MSIGTPAKLSLLALLALSGALQAATPPKSAPAEPSTTEAAIQHDQQAALRYIGLRLQKQQELLKRGRDAEAVKLEAECLRQEAKCLGRYLWYVRHDEHYKAKAKALATAIDDIKKKDPKASLEERKKAGFKPADLVVNPLGIASAPVEQRPSETHSFSSATASDISVNKPNRELRGASDPRFSGAKPPPGADTPADAGSAGSAGSGSNH